MKDNRDPETIGTALAKMKARNPLLTMSQCADMYYSMASTAPMSQIIKANADRQNGSHANNNPDH